MRSLRLFAVFLIVMVGVGLTTASAANQQPSARFDGRNVTITGITPNGLAILFGVGLEPKGYYSQICRWSGAVDDVNHDGSVTVDLGREAPPMTIWCVADATTAEYSIVSPGGSAIPFIALRPGSLRRAGGSAVKEFAFDHPVIDLLYLEPGGRGWTCSDADGSSTESDGPNGLSTVSVDRFRAIPPAADHPAELRAGGVLVAIDFIRMEVVAVRLDAATIGGAK